jgi:hypothetical protein
MAEYVDPRFRPTLWPGTVIPVPALQPFSNAEVDGDWIRWRFAPRSGQPFQQLPEDFYLRELIETPADDLEAAAALYTSYGTLFSMEGKDIDLDDYPDVVRDEFAAIPVTYPDADDRFGGVHRDMVTIHLEKAQQAVTTWLACQREGGLEEQVEPEVTMERLAKFNALNADVGRPLDLDGLRGFLIDYYISEMETIVQAALAPFSIGFGDLADRNPTVYSVAFLQLYNHMAEGAVARRCENETCRRNFVRQRGRAEYGQYRTSGVKYCCRECARAQAQRALRRRHRAEAGNS